MPQFRGINQAFGAPGLEPRWSPAAKQGIGTSDSLGSRIWFTVAQGILTEVFYPTVDEPQIRDAEFIFTDGNHLFLEEKRDLDHEVERIEHTQGYRITSRDREGRFRYEREIIADPRRASILIRTRLHGEDSFLRRLGVHFLCAPHLRNGGANNNAYVIEAAGRELLAAEKQGLWMIAGASCRFRKLSCGYVGSSDGYTDLKANHRMTFEFDEAKDGNAALTGELDLADSTEFTLVLAFGEALPAATSALLQSLGEDYRDTRASFIELWRGAVRDRMPLEDAGCDKGRLFRSSYNVILSHEDKIYQGAFVASLSTPWGEVRNDEHKGGYHLVWARDMVQSALGLLAAGNKQAPLRVLIYLAARQHENGEFTQNFRVDGETFRHGSQLDEIAFPLILAWRLKREGLLANFDPGVMVRRAINFLLLKGPVTGEERWEESSGYSPSTLATIISACICAAAFERDKGQSGTASFVESYADFLRAHLEDWTVTSKGWFVRLNPAKPGEVASPGAADDACLTLTSQAPGRPASFPASEIIDAGFLQLVRYGILSPDDPIVLRSIQKVDAELKNNTPLGVCWRRYNHDGYGQRPDGSAFDGWGEGRSWPLLTGERAHYELAAGHDCTPLIRAMENFAGSSGLLPEQIWDRPGLPQAGMRCGGPTGSAAPLVWAHSEYLRVLRSRHDGKIFDLIPEVARRYGNNKSNSRVEYWLPIHPISKVRKGCVLRICASEPFALHWTHDNWLTFQNNDSQASGIGAEFFDLPKSAADAGVEFTFFWKGRNEWEGRNYRVEAQ